MTTTLPAPAEPDVHRCARNALCAERAKVEDEDGRTWWLGALLADPGLCQSCARHVRSAIAQLPGDVTELSSPELLCPTGERRWRDPDMPAAPHTKPGSRTPWRDDVYALVELIDAETTMWANSVARAAGMDPPTTLDVDEDGQRLDPRTGEWSPADLARLPRGARVAKCCALLGHRMPYLLGLPTTEHPARSVTARRGDGHDPDTTTVYGDDLWANRTGVDGALLLLGLHRDTERLTGRAPADLLPLPCPKCKRPALVRLHSAGRIDCRSCGDPGGNDERFTDDDYDDYEYGLWQHHGLDDPPEKPVEPIVPPTEPPAGSYRLRPIQTSHRALDVTAGNLRDVAEWCGGAVQSHTDEWGVTERWVAVPGSTRNARPGDTLVYCPALGRNPPQWVVDYPEAVERKFERVP